MAKKKTNLDSRTTALKSGGAVTLELDCSMFDLNQTDREFVTQLVDLFHAYEDTPSEAEVSADKSDSGTS